MTRDSITTRPWFCPRVDCPASGHDSYTAYNRGCRSGKSRIARSQYLAELRAGTSRLASPVGITRRIEACHYTGHTGVDIGRVLGVDRRAVNRTRLGRGAFMWKSTVRRVGPQLERLAMTPTGDLAINKKTRTWARNRGFRSLLAWADVDIDDPSAQPAAPARLHVASRADLLAPTDFDDHAFDAVRDGRLRITDVTSREQDDIVERMWRDQLTRVERPGSAIAELLGVEYALIDRIRARTIKRQAHQYRSEAS